MICDTMCDRSLLGEQIRQRAPTLKIKNIFPTLHKIFSRKRWESACTEYRSATLCLANGVAFLKYEHCCAAVADEVRWRKKAGNRDRLVD
jgi:hypothetical protein